MTDQNNKSDYNKPYMDLLKYLPEPYQSDVNISLFSNLFNRFLTKSETVKVSGYIGRGNKNAITPRQIKEKDVHRQAFQLQPIINNKIGTIEHMASWKDIQNELTRLGVDVEKFAEWGAIQEFNWVPPIDINKLINYSDYYWVDETRSVPQYITIRSRCAVSTSRSNFWEGLMTQYGDTFPIIKMLPIDNVDALPLYTISAINHNTSNLSVEGDATAVLSKGDFFDIVDSIDNNGTYTITSIPSYNGISNATTFTILEKLNNITTLTVSNTISGSVKLRSFDKLVIGANDVTINGDYGALFEKGFVFFIVMPSNPSLHNRFVEVAESLVDIANLRTTVTITLAVTDDTITDGLGSLIEQNSVYIADKNCQCGLGLAGFDDILWDDNPDSPLWGDNENAAGGSPPDGISDHQNLLDRISNPSPPVNDGIQDELWYDTTADILYQYDVTLGWEVTWNDFSLLLAATDGLAFWDLAPSCDTTIRIDATDQWILENKWFHKNDVLNFASARRATQPIIEYEWDIELNEWTIANYKWSYRREITDDYADVEQIPASIELDPIFWWELDPITSEVILDSRYGDQTSWFVNGINIDINNVKYEVIKSTYKTITVNGNEYPLRTYVTLAATPQSSLTVNLDLGIPNTLPIIPTFTSQGDSWVGYGIHWLFVELTNVLPDSHQTINPYIAIPAATQSTIDPIGYEYVASRFAQVYQIRTAISELLLNDVSLLPFDTVPLRRKALFGFDDVRVYSSDFAGENITRQFGNFDEIGEVTLNILDIDTTSSQHAFIVELGMGDYFASGETIRVYGNATIGTVEYTVSNGTNNRIEVGTADLTGISISGDIINLTKPLLTNNIDHPSLMDTVSSLTSVQNIKIFFVGISFISPSVVENGTLVTIEVGPASIDEIGNSYNNVRTISDEEQFNLIGNTPISRIEYRKVEQVKTKVNQYPLFDIYTVDGNHANKVNPIFGYKTSSDSDVNLTGLRIVYDADNNIYEFDQFILDNDNGELFAYRDYANKEQNFWFNPETNQVSFWKGIAWDTKIEMSQYYREAIVAPEEPTSDEWKVENSYWYDTVNDTLNRFVSNKWSPITPIDRYVTDINLQTIWKSGTDDDLYVPEKVDWIRRSQVEYNTEENEYVTVRANELIITNPSLTLPEATKIATDEWLAAQSNHISISGEWVGDWEIPDPLYYNNLHENRKYLTSRELLTHFTTIIEKQPRIPGYSGLKSSMFSLIPANEVNYALGGTIKEFNDGFDSLLSATFVDNVTPITLIDFAHGQYESLLNSIKEIYRINASTLFTDMNPVTILNLSASVVSEIIRIYELNDQASFVYGDTTTFTDVDGLNDLGVRNWIATLPYVSLIEKHIPERIVDEQLSLDEVIHHDGHRNGYTLTNATVDIMSKIIISTPDPRTNDSNIGIQSLALPPNDTTEFTAAYSSPITNREGVYWYQVTPVSTNTLYRYVVAASGLNFPSPLFDDGALWMDTSIGLGTLREKKTDFNGTVTWDVVQGLIIGEGKLHNGTDVTDALISAWQPIQIIEILNDVIFELENKLYENVPDFPALAYDTSLIKENYPVDYDDNLEITFLNYISQLGIDTPFINTKFNANDPFTWNYKRSIQGGGFNIIEADGLTNSFLVTGDQLFFFDPCQASKIDGPPVSYTECTGNRVVRFSIKNSSVNDGTWETLQSNIDNFTAFYNSNDDTTRIFVQGDVIDAFDGVIHDNKLPSSENDGSESGGDWRDYYTKIYGTPYPNLEPWILQGYKEKPDWWDNEYLNDDTSKWGIRRWKYKHGFDIIKAEDVIDIDGNFQGRFNINGDFNNIFKSTKAFIIDKSTGTPNNNNSYVIGFNDIISNVTNGNAGGASIIINDPNNNGTLIYSIGMKISIVDVTGNIKNEYLISSLTRSVGILTIGVLEEITAGDIIIGNDYINGAIYEPITNQTFIKITTTLNSPSQDGRIITFNESGVSNGIGMWENIRIGVIPVGVRYPNGAINDDDSSITLPTYTYFSVNISNDGLSADGGTTNYVPDELFPPYWDHLAALNTYSAEIDSFIRSIFNDFTTEIITPSANYTFGDAGDVEWEWRTSSRFLYDQLTISYRIDPVRYVSSTFGFNYTIIGGLQVDRNTNNTPSHTRTNFHGDVVKDKQFISNGLNQWYVNFNRYSGYDSNFSNFKELWTGWTAPLTYQFASFLDTPSLDVGHRFVSVTEFDYNITSKRAPGVADFWLDAFKISILKMPPKITYYNNQNDWRFNISTNANLSRNIKYYAVHNYQFYITPETNECLLYTWEILAIESFNRAFFVVGDQTQIFNNGSQFDIINSLRNDDTYDVISSTYDILSDRTKIFVNNIILSASTVGLIRAKYRTFEWVTGDYVYLSSSKVLPAPLLGATINGLTKYFIIVEANNIFKLAETKNDALIGHEIDIISGGIHDHFVGDINNTFVANEGVRSKDSWIFYAVDKRTVLEINTPSEIQGIQNVINIVHGYDNFSNDIGWAINEDKSQIDFNFSNTISWKSEIERFITHSYAQRVISHQVSERYNVNVDYDTNIFTFVESNEIFITSDSIKLLSSNRIYPAPLSGNINYYVIRDTLETFRLAESPQHANDGIAINIIDTPNVGNLQIHAPNTILVNNVAPFELNPFRNAIWLNTETGIVSDIIKGPVEDIRATQSIFNQKGENISPDQLRVYRQDLQTKIQVVNAVNDDLLFQSEYTSLHLGGLHLFIDAYEHAMVLNNYNSEGSLLYDPFIGLNVTKYEMIFSKNPKFTNRPNIGGYTIETFFNQGANITQNIEAGIENLRYAYDTYTTLESDIMKQYSRKALGYDGETEYMKNINVSEKSQFLFWRGQIQNKGSINAINAFTASRRFIDAKLDDFWAIKIGDFGTIRENEYPEMFVTTVDARSNELRLQFLESDSSITADDTFIPITMADSDRWYNQPDQIKVLRDNGKVMYFDMKIKNKKAVKYEDISPNPNDIAYVQHMLDADIVTITVIVDGIQIQLIEDDEYVLINNNVIRFIPPTTITTHVDEYGIPVNDFIIWGYVVNDNAQNPARIIDRKSETQISPIQYWDPARNKHYSNAIHNVDLQNDADPARYTNTQLTIKPNEWAVSNVGTTWLNTSKLKYVPYYSEQMIPDITERFRSWGQLSDLGSIEILEWVESDVPPNEWDALAVTEEGDRTIPEHLRKSGIARQMLLEKDPNSGSPSPWIHVIDIIQERYTATDATKNTTSYIFNVDSNLFYRNNGILNVYVNGKLYREGWSADDDGNYKLFLLDELKESDIVEFVQLAPTTQEEIDIEVTAGRMIQDYEYTRVSFYDELSKEFFKYYFWVGSKATKPINRNRTMSSFETSIQMASIPAAHMFFQNPTAPPVTLPTEAITINRIEDYDVPVRTNIINAYTLDLLIALNTSVKVEINSVDSLANEISYVEGTNTVNILSLPPNLPTADNYEVKITYTGDSVNTIDMPYRYTQVIIRGLQGIINADRRYTIRFTRNFTLRDELNIERLENKTPNSVPNDTPFDNNDVPNDVAKEVIPMNLHEEWKIFRREQQYNIDRWQWDRITESIVGFKLNDQSVRVPSYERELYDDKYLTDTQYGLDDGQSFANGKLALSSIIAYLIDPEIDFTPIDINTFFSENNFNTTEDIISTMNEIYNTFAFNNINRMYFSVLLDAFTTKRKYSGILKTSMISLHGIQPFQTSGVFDD